MFSFECKKTVSNSFFLGLFIILILLNALLSYSEAKHDPATDLSEDVLAALEAYNEDPEAWKAEYDRLTSYYNEVFYPKVQQEMQEFYEQNPNAHEYTWELDDDAEKYWNYRNAQRYMAEIDSYPKDLKRVVKAAIIAKEDFQIVGDFFWRCAEFCSRKDV